MINIHTYNDQQLIGLIQNGGRDLEIAFEQLLAHEKRYKSIRKLVVGMGAQVADYEEILDDTLIAVHGSIVSGRYHERASIYSYMHGIAKNLWLKRCAKRKLQLVPLSFETDQEDQGIEVNIIANERRELLLNVVKRLGDKCRKLLVKSFIEGLKNNELVSVMNYKNDAVVRKAKSQCLKKLITYFHQDPELLNQLR